MADTPCLWWDDETGKVYGIKPDGLKVEYVIREYDDGLVFIEKTIDDDINSYIYRDYFIGG